MSNPATPEASNKLSKSKSSSKSSKKSKSRHRNRRGSNNSNASIISIDPVSLKSLRQFQEKVAKENKKQKYLYRQQKKSQFEDITKKYISRELKEEDEYKFSDNKPLHLKKTSYAEDSSPYNEDSSPSTDKHTPHNATEDITVEELLPLIKNLVDRHNKLQVEYDLLDRELREQKILMEDKITQLEQQQIEYDLNDDSYGIAEDVSGNNNSLGGRGRKSIIGITKIRVEYEDKIEILKNNYESNLLSIQSGYEQDIETQKKEIKTLNKELTDYEREIDALRQSLEALEHENQSLRISMNNNNKQFANIKLIKNKNKQLILENDTLRQQIQSLEQEMDSLIQEQEEMQQENINTNNRNFNEKNNNNRPHTPQHNYGKTILVGNRDQLDMASGKGSLLNLSDHDSSMGNDLLNQIGDINNDYHSANQSSADPPDRASNYSEYEDEDEDEKKINDSDSHSRDTILANLSKYKNIAAGDPDSMAQILALLQEKENKRLGTNTGQGNSNPSQDVIDNYSVASNYSDSEQELKEQIDNIEDDIRELKDMVLSLMDSTNNLTPQINANLGPLVRKINRMYVMLSGGASNYINPIGPSESITSEIVLPDNKSDYSESQISSQRKNNNGKNWIAWITPYINDWMPSVGFSAIILSTMYLLIKYHKGRFIGIGQPRVLRNKRAKLI